MRDDIVQFNVDAAHYIGDDYDGCYFQVAEVGGDFFVTVIVDCDTGGFVHELAHDDGPYPTEAAAEAAGRNAALEWCTINGVTT